MNVCMYVHVDKTGANGLIHIGMRLCMTEPGLPIVYHASEFTGMVLGRGSSPLPRVCATAQGVGAAAQQLSDLPVIRL